ncbi:MAG TPA: carboxypeptidase regulatory-like domain-containing protein [Candidatus Acidoferrales bacterium]|nr:carboxypeptidase regulatory-like domain-containing protein [Candidatus Acidoferrales bacterium]
MASRLFKRVAAIAVVVLLFAVCAQISKAQDTADVVGTVTDASGAIIPGATVTLTNIGTNVQQTTQTSGTGDYVFTLLQVGTYSIKVEAKGFKAFVAPNVNLSAGDRARADAKLEVGDVSQTVEVSGVVAPALQTDTSTIGTLVTSQAVEDLPLDGRNIVKLVQLSAGTTEGAPGSIAAGNRPDDRRQTSAFSANGQGDSENESMIDGFDNNERMIGTIGARPSIDAIQEVNVSLNKYDASVGRTGGAVVDIITKSGTNSFHGSAFEFFRNKVLNTNPNYNFTLANNPAGSATCPTAAACPAAPNPAFRQNQFGGSVGGPIIKNKTFFFVDYEALHLASGLASTLFSVPTLCEKGKAVCPDGLTQYGDFSDYPTVGQPNIQSTQACSNAAGSGAYTYGSATCPYVVIPAASMTPIGKAFFNMYPLPNTGTAGALTNNYVVNPVRTQNSHTWDGRVDQHFSDRNTLYGRITYNQETTITPNGFPNVTIDPATGNLASSGVTVEPVVTSYAGPNNEDQYSFGLSYVHVFSPSVILNLKAGVFRSQILSFPANQATFISTKLGFPCTATSCVNYAPASSLVGSSGLVRMTVSGLNSGGSLTTIGDTTFVPLGYWDTNFQYGGFVTWNKGSHSIRMGLNLNRRRAGVAQSNNAQGGFTFNGSFTGVAQGDLLEGLAYSQTRNNALVQQGFRMWEPSGYIQDDWRARSWLTLNLGLRYDIFTAYTEVHGRISNYDPYNGLLVSPSLPGIQQSNSTAMVSTPYKDFAPRVGFAATLKHDMVLRGGFGLSFFPTNYRSDYYFQNAPFNYSFTCGVGNTAGSGGATTNLECAGQFQTAAVPQYGTTGTGSGLAPVLGGPAVVGLPGGSLVAGGLPIPSLNVALATDTSKYAGTSMIPVPINQQEAYLEMFNMQLQKQFGANVFSIGYVGELGRHAEINGFQQNQPTQPQIAGQPPNPAALPPLTVGGSTPLGVLQGYPYMSSVGMTVANNWGTSAYQGLQASFVRRFNNGLTVNLNYTWSHTMSDITNGSCVSSYFATRTPCFVDTTNGATNSASAKTAANELAAEAVAKKEYSFEQYGWGNDPLDTPDRITWGVNYTLPFAKSATGVEGQLLKGWGLNTSGSWQTGLPFSVTAASNTSLLGPTQYLDQIGSGKLSNPSIHQWFKLTDFVQPSWGTLGNQHYDQVFGPHQKRLDFSIFKEFPIKEQIHLQFRTEVFNLFNQTNFNTPTSSIAFLAGTGNQVGAVNLTGTRATTGQINSMNGNWNQREIQFGLKLLF